MEKEEKVWIVFLAHLYFKIEEKINYHVTTADIPSSIPVIEFRESFISKLKNVWKNGAEYINFEDSDQFFVKLKRHRLLELGDGFSSNIQDVFRKVFGVDMYNKYSKVVYDCKATLGYDIRLNGGLYFYQCDEAKNFQFKDNLIEIYEVAYASVKLKEKIKNCFEKDFLVFFEEHIGTDFSKAEDFFEVYLR